MKKGSKKKVVEVEEAPPSDSVMPKKPKREPIVIKDQVVPVPRFFEGEKVRYTSVYGIGKVPPQPEKEPYRIVNRSLQYQWLNDMNFAWLYRVSRWDTADESVLLIAWDTTAVWESQLESWKEEHNG